jgi:hypothetical protein
MIAWNCKFVDIPQIASFAPKTSNCSCKVNDKKKIVMQQNVLN